MQTPQLESNWRIEIDPFIYPKISFNIRATNIILYDDEWIKMCIYCSENAEQKDVINSKKEFGSIEHEH
ncbi:hypothetical protein BLOT_014271 [Blomia tropicalis]|nr:hypothetical protein BLOT_014271 [Blomia tropicalis]